LLEFFPSCLNVLLKRSIIFVMLNILFFDCIFVGVLLSNFLHMSQPFGSEFEILVRLHGLDWVQMILVIFLFNFVVSGIVTLTLSGLVCFFLSAIFLGLRGVLWGVMLSQPSNAPFLFLSLVIILEGEGYVLASTPGIILGLSWLKPKWLYKDEHLSRINALKIASREALHLVFLSALFLFSAAIVKTLTIISS